jgi:hypothetical protein
MIPPDGRRKKNDVLQKFMNFVTDFLTILEPVWKFEGARHKIFTDSYEGEL